MPANRREPVPVPFWFQSKKIAGMARSHMCFVGGRHAGDRPNRGHGPFMPSGAPTTKIRIRWLVIPALEPRATAG